jgi:uncharacterized membrane protein YdfJ with MMPL/SSD domain
MHWVSAPLIDREFRAFSSHEASRGEKIALPLTLAVLVAVFGSVTAALFPLVLGAWAIPVALGAAMLVAALWPMSAIVVNVITMIGLALSIDYSLLVMDGFHELMAKGCTRHQAAMESARNAGQTVCVSGSAVAVGFASLLVVPVSEIRSVAIGGLLATVTAVFLAMTLLPIALSFIGPRPSRRKLKRYDAEKFTLSVWVRWGRFVVAHPTAVLLAAAIPLLILSAQAERIKLELPSGNWLPPQAESTAAIEDLRRIDRGTLSDEITLVLQAPQVRASPLRMDGLGCNICRALSLTIPRWTMSCRRRVSPVRNGLALPSSIDCPRRKSALSSARTAVARLPKSCRHTKSNSTKSRSLCVNCAARSPRLRASLLIR